MEEEFDLVGGITTSDFRLATEYINTTNSQHTTNVIGTIKRLKNGTCPIEIIDAKMSYGILHVQGRYLRSGSNTKFRPYTDFVDYEDEKEIEEVKEETKMNAMKDRLFQTLEDTPRYGVGLAVGADGKYVLNMKDGGYEAFDVDAIKKVMPFTFDVKFMGSNKTYSYTGKEGSVAVGDVLLKTSDSNFTIARVVAVGTESESANIDFDGVKLATTAL